MRLRSKRGDPEPPFCTVWRYLGYHEPMHPDQVALRAGSDVAGAQADHASRRWDADWA